jgi:hypothetical protein
LLQEEIAKLNRAKDMVTLDELVVRLNGKVTKKTLQEKIKRGEISCYTIARVQYVDFQLFLLETRQMQLPATSTSALGEAPHHVSEERILDLINDETFRQSRTG